MGQVKPEVKRQFVFAPAMKALGERVEAAEKAAEEARELLEDMAASDDLLERLCYLVLAVRDWKAGNLSEDELYERSRNVLDGIRDTLPEVIVAELGAAYTR
ncbi:MAG: hypothetical protein QOF36_2503 [Microbacteriaceae bacterium]|jgi:hypothetical protein|nr:hypothetical protein [Microbacteriaceae bacterium]